MIFFKLLSPLGLDFGVYFEAAYLTLRGINPYRGIISSTFPFNYPPTSLLFLWPLGLLPQNIAAVFWNLSSLAALILSIYLLLKLKKQKSFIAHFLLLIFLFTFPFFPVKFNLGMGQINHFVLLFSVAAVYFYETGRKNLSAFFLAFAFGIKFAPIIFLLYFILQRDYKQLFRFAFASCPLFLVSLLLVPFDWQKVYFLNVLPMSFTMGAKDWYYNQSLFGFLARTIHDGVVVQISFYTLAAVILFFTWWKGRKLPILKQIAAVSCLYLLIHPIALQHYFSFAIIPLILLGFNRWTIISYVLIAANIKQPGSVPPEFSFILSHQFFGILLLWLKSLFF